MVYLICSKFCAQGHDGRYSIYIHASREKPVHSSSLFVGREIHSEKVLSLPPHFTYALSWLMLLNFDLFQSVKILSYLDCLCDY